MPKPFTGEEKNKIRSLLLNKGKELFTHFGLNKTGVSDLTRAVGIAQGSFYLFFNSKEELYFKIIELEEQAIRERFIKWLSENEPITHSRFKEFLQLSLNVFEENPFLRKLWLEDEMNELLRKLPTALIDEHTKRDNTFMEPLIKHWQEKGYMIDSSPKAITGVIRSIFILPLHRKEIGEDIFPQVIEMYIDFIASGLIKKKQNTI